MKVWYPERGIKYMDTIASEEAHIGNRIAEGDLPEAEFWPHMAKYYQRRARESEIRYAEWWQEYERKLYARDWIYWWNTGTAVLDVALPRPEGATRGGSLT